LIIGFSEDAEEFRCYGCPEGFSQDLLYFSRKKPNVEECLDKPCVCMCQKGLGTTALIDGKSTINCKTYSCKTLENDIYSTISLEPFLRNKKVGLVRYPYWENGFIFLRGGDLETPFNTLVPPSDLRRNKIYIEKKNVDGEVFVAACPFPPCIP
jgi:hypothetical protein